MNYNKNVYNYGKNNIKYNPSVSKRVFEEYLEMYPKDYFAYIYYSKVLINLGYFNDALKVLKCVKEEALIDNKFNKYKTANKDNFYKDVLEADLLIIDDLGTECLNSMKLSELFTILNTRILNLNNKVTKTIISTNLNINNIFKSYEERIGSRIVGYYDIYYFFGEDLRFKRK